MRSDIERVKSSFVSLYDKIILPVLEKYESQRKFYCARIIFLNILIVSLFVFTCYVEFMAGDFDILLMSSLFLLICLSPILIIYKVNKSSLSNAIKSTIMTNLPKYSDCITWYKEYPIEKEIFIQSGLISDYKYASTKDVILGKYNGCDINFADGRLIVGSKNFSKIVYNGVLIKIDIGGDFLGHTIITSSNKANKDILKKLQIVIVKNKEISKKYKVYSNSQNEVRFLLTSIFLKKIKNINAAFNYRKIDYAFFKNHIIILIPDLNDALEVESLFRPIVGKEQYQKYLDRILSVIDFTDIADSYNKSGVT